jgi:putative transposase
MGFVHDQLSDGRAFRVFAAVDVFTRECVALVARPRFRGADVAAVLTAVGEHRPLPAVIRCTSVALDHWAYARGVRLDFSRRGTPTDNAVAESFNASLRRECLSQALFSTPAEVEHDLRAWQADYNNCGPHTSLGNCSPAHFRARHSPGAAAAAPRGREA